MQVTEFTKIKCSQYPLDKREKGLSLIEVNLPLLKDFSSTSLSLVHAPPKAVNGRYPLNIRPRTFGFLFVPLCLFYMLCGMSGGVCCTFFISCPQNSPGNLPKVIINQPLSCLLRHQGAWSTGDAIKKIVYILFFWFKGVHKQWKQLLITFSSMFICYIKLSWNFMYQK